MTLNRQARLGIDQALELLDDSDMEGDLSNSENEDGDNSYLPDEFEIAQREADNEPSLNDSDMQQAQITSGTEVQNDTDNLASASQDNAQTDSQSQTSHSGPEDVSQFSSTDPSHSASSTATIAPFSPPPFTAQFPPGPHHHFPGTASVN